MLSILFGLITAIPGLASKFLEWQVAKSNNELQGFTTATGVDLAAYQAYLAAQVETNRMKVAANGWWGAKVIILMAGIPASLHFAAVFLDTVVPPFGSWGIPKIPPPYDGYQWAIVQSFFIVMPAMPIVSAVAQWLGRKR